ncbi:hypothetical protein [uncultured Peptoniphilus sp.]|uniref:hypothetical protein n=1 Tax=uncultured Peptoniphilus sp. TaxID=254354 RepID=UPI0025F24EC6|nr:hypothetical protein [uncultured Peptoniphilus sp.]
MKKKYFPVFLLVLFTLLNCVFANSNNFEDSSKNKYVNLFDLIRYEVVKELKQEGVSERDINNLMEKLDNGELWDCMKDEYRDLRPQIDTDRYKKTIYPDGSFKVAEIKPLNEESKTSIDSQNKYTVRFSLGVVRLSFDVDISRNETLKKTKIKRQYNKNIYTAVGKYSEDAYGHDYGWKPEAHAWLAIYAKGKDNLRETRLWVRAHVNGNRIWTETSGGF